MMKCDWGRRSFSTKRTSTNLTFENECQGALKLLSPRSSAATNVRLEVGTARRYIVEVTIQINNHELIIYAIRLVQGAPVGGAQL
jgi:hypothetical protein